ncbi:MAG: hypothetical protein J6K20_05965 [Thermoguttaceae bacterium]|nr:hypothetical protein [Thermoguttaceae bacterium]
MSKNIENRRAFFKKAAQAALAVPFLAVAAQEIPAAETQVGPSASCTDCTGYCKGGCSASCGNNCSGYCSGTCTTSCGSNCTGYCKGTCKTSSGSY